MNKVSYALGLSLGQNLASSGIKEIAFEDLVAGMKAIADQVVLTVKHW